jgi:hypothetical protein
MFYFAPALVAGGRDAMGGSGNTGPKVPPAGNIGKGRTVNLGHPGEVDKLAPVQCPCSG